MCFSLADVFQFGDLPRLQTGSLTTSRWTCTHTVTRILTWASFCQTRSEASVCFSLAVASPRLPFLRWDLLNITVERKREFYNYGYFPSLVYRIHIKRKPFYYICNLIAPSLIITTTAVIGYHMPSTSQGVHQEKVKMGLTAILSIFILQLGISDKMPRTSDVIPLISTKLTNILLHFLWVLTFMALTYLN